MSTFFTFVIPVRHPDNAPDWSSLVRRLDQTIGSLQAQSSDGSRVIVVANRCADLSLLPAGVEIVRVDFAANPNYEIAGHDKEQVYDSFRLDKGRRVLSGMLAAPRSDYFMVVDDDDFVHRDLVAFVTAHSGENGWKIDRGWLWSEGSSVVLRQDDFSSLCGTSLIVRADLYALPERSEEASEEYVKAMLGSHVQIASILKARGTPLTSLPFAGAVYRVGHSGAHSRSAALWQRVVNRQTARRPWASLKMALCLRPVTRRFRRHSSVA